MPMIAAMANRAGLEMIDITGVATARNVIDPMLAGFWDFARPIEDRTTALRWVWLADFLRACAHRVHTYSRAAGA